MPIVLWSKKGKSSHQDKHVIRFLSPEKQKVKTVDVIRGESVIDSSLLDDKILIKANGTPTYHFANVGYSHFL